MPTITIFGREFTVKVIPADPDSAGINNSRPRYEFRGKRGALYASMRNVVDPDYMLLVDMRGKMIKILDPVLTDKDGTLRVVRG